MTDKKHLTITQDNRTLLSGNITVAEFIEHESKFEVFLEGLISTEIRLKDIAEIRVRSEGKEYKFIFEDK